MLLGDKTSPILYGYDQNAMGAMYKNGPNFALGMGGGRGGGGRGGGLPAGVGGGNLSPMAASPRLTTLDSGPPAGATAGAGRGGRGGGGGGFGGGRGFGGGGAAANQPRVLLSYPTDPNDLLLSGELVGGEGLAGRPALIDAQVGKGHVVLFGVRPFWRFETQGSFFLAFNAILNWNDLNAGRQSTTGAGR